MKREIPRLQHYVPQLLLRQFAGADGKLWAYDADTRKMFCARPKGLAAEGYFYGATTKHATPKSTAIETWLSNEIDGPGAEAITLLLERRTLSTEQVQAFFRFVAAQMQRTPESLKRLRDFSAPIFQETAERIAKHEPRFRKNVIARIKANGATEDEISELIRIFDEGRLTVTPTRDFVLCSAFRYMDLIASELAQMRWTFLLVHASDGDLIIGDHPVTLIDTRPGNGALGVKNPFIEIAMPISRRMVALAHWDGPISYGELAPGEADRLNERTLGHMLRFAYAPFKSEELLTRAVALRGTGPKMRTRRLQIGEQLITATELR